MSGMRQIWNRVRDRAIGSESGISLVLAVSILGGISITGATAIQFASSNELAAERSFTESEAQVLADAGHALARSVLWDPGTDVNDPSAIPVTVATIDGNMVTYSGSYDSAAKIWTLTGTASVNNPNATGADIVKSVSSKVQVAPGATVPDDNTVAAWSSIYVDYWAPPDGPSCAKVDDTFVIRIEVYIRGDLCMDDDSTIDAQAGRVQVWGNIDVDDDSSVGSAANPIPFLAVGGNTQKWAGQGLGAGCRDEKPDWSSSNPAPFDSPCTAANSTYSTVFSDSPEDLTMPPMDLDYWYNNSKPGPMYPCTSGSLPSGEEFDDDTIVNNESANTFELTTVAAYDCKYEDPVTGGLIGRLAWSGGTTGTLTILGTIFFDGDIHVRDGVGVRAQYDGQATLYSSAEIEVEDDVWLCGVPACDETSQCPGFGGVGFLGSGGCGCVEFFIFDWCEHVEAGVASAAVVEDLDVFEDGVGELDPGFPAARVQEFDLHA